MYLGTAKVIQGKHVSWNSQGDPGQACILEQPEICNKYRYLVFYC